MHFYSLSYDNLNPILMVWSALQSFSFVCLPTCSQSTGKVFPLGPHSEATRNFPESLDMAVLVVIFIYLFIKTSMHIKPMNKLNFSFFVEFIKKSLKKSALLCVRVKILRIQTLALLILIPLTNNIWRIFWTGMILTSSWVKLIKNVKK
jgi:hypothetical protein